MATHSIQNYFLTDWGTHWTIKSNYNGETKIVKADVIGALKNIFEEGCRNLPSAPPEPIPFNGPADERAAKSLTLMMDDPVQWGKTIEGKNIPNHLDWKQDDAGWTILANTRDDPNHRSNVFDHYIRIHIDAFNKAFPHNKASYVGVDKLLTNQRKEFIDEWK